jgi:sugar/nucleoside kinase (ribokinase family)
VSFTLSDPFCVERHHGEFLELVDGAIDVLFGNRQELCALYRTNDVEDAIREVQGRCEIAAITRGAEGCTVVTADELIEVPAEDVPHVVDTTGAGDLFASGFLYGLSLDLDLEVCARLASVAAAEVISHLGARPEVWLHDLATQVLRGEI